MCKNIIAYFLHISYRIIISLLYFLNAWLMDTDYFFLDSPKSNAKRIFIVDDDEPIRTIITEILEVAGYMVNAFENGMQAVKHALITPPHVILLDYFLPGEDTNHLISKFRLLETMKHVPIILISASHLAKKAAEEWRVDAFLEKPFQAQTLLQAINKCDK